MSKNFNQEFEKLNRPWFYAVAWGGGAFLILLSGLLWWNKIYLSNDNVFWGMIDTNLATSGVTRAVDQTTAQQSINQKTQLVFGAHNFVAARAESGQKTQTGETNVIMETIGTTTADYVRYAALNNNGKQMPGTDNIVGVWAKTTYGDNNHEISGKLLSEALFSKVLIGNLNPKQRNELVTLLKISKAYEVDYSKTKHETKDGQQVYVFSAKLNLKAYVGVLKQYAKDMHVANAEGLNPEDYADSAPLPLTLSVSPVARQLVSINYENGSSETFSSYGARKNLSEPAKTISTAELQSRLQTLQQ